MIPALDVFKLRCWARAYLFAVGEFSLQEAVDVLWAAAVATELVKNLGPDKVQTIVADAFAEVCR